MYSWYASFNNDPITKIDKDEQERLHLQAQRQGQGQPSNGLSQSGSGSGSGGGLNGNQQQGSGISIGLSASNAVNQSRDVNNNNNDIGGGSTSITTDQSKNSNNNNNNTWNALDFFLNIPAATPPASSNDQNPIPDTITNTGSSSYNPILGTSSDNPIHHQERKSNFLGSFDFSNQPNQNQIQPSQNTLNTYQNPLSSTGIPSLSSNTFTSQNPGTTLTLPLPPATSRTVGIGGGINLANGLGVLGGGRLNMSESSRSTPDSRTHQQHQRESNSVDRIGPGGGSGQSDYQGSYHALGPVNWGTDYGAGNAAAGPSRTGGSGRAMRMDMHDTGGGMEALTEAAAVAQEGQFGLGPTTLTPEGDLRRSIDYGPASDTKGKGKEGDMDVEKQVLKLQTYIQELITLLKPFTEAPGGEPAEPPPSVMRSRFDRMSHLIHSTLLTLSPNVLPVLSAQFNISPPIPLRATSPDTLFASVGRGQTNAEQEMEVIRKRRDMLIARAAQNKLQQQSQHGGGDNTSPPDSPKLPTAHDIIAMPLSMGSTSPLPPSTHYHSLRNDDYDGNSGGGGAVPGPRYQGGYDHQIGVEDNEGFWGTPPGRCHGCGITVTASEWRRGPDGPKSLCDNCGRHYARLASRDQEIMQLR